MVIWCQLSSTWSHHIYFMYMGVRMGLKEKYIQTKSSTILALDGRRRCLDIQIMTSCICNMKFMTSFIWIRCLKDCFLLFSVASDESNLLTQIINWNIVISNLDKHAACCLDSDDLMKTAS
nr:uncharacterized protein LOC113723002 isoform X1 [Coffea arabica]